MLAAASLIVLVLALVSAQGQGDKILTIGAVLSNDSHSSMFREAVGRLNPPPGYRYRAYSVVSHSDPVSAAKLICSSLLPQKVVTVVYEVDQVKDKFMSSVPFTLEFYKIPVVGVSSRCSVLTNTYAHPYFLRTLPPYSFESSLWFRTLQKLKYNKVVFLYTNNVEGETNLNGFRNRILQSDTAYGEKSLEICKLILLQPYKTNFTEDLQPILAEDSRVILLAAGPEVAINVYAAARELGIFGSSYVWIVSEQALISGYTPQGTLSWAVPPSVTNLKSNIEDAVALIHQGITEYLSLDKTLDYVPMPTSCGVRVQKSPDDIQVWETEIGWWKPGIELYKLYKESKMSGMTGVLRFNEEGDRLYSNYNLVNIADDGSERLVGNWSTIFNTSTDEVDEELYMKTEEIIWPGGQPTKPAGVDFSKHLRVVTIQATPFIYTEAMKAGDECNETQLYDDTDAKMRCPKYLSNGTVIEFCCYGYLIDMLDMLRINMSVTFSLHLVADDKYGNLQSVSNSSTKSEWNGLMGELLNDKADLIVAPFTIDPERAKYVDFTKPFKFLGITILTKKNTKVSSLDSFLQPFQQTLWFLVVVSVHVIALVLYLLDRFSPFGQLQLARVTNSEDSLSLSTAVWFAWGVLLNSGIGEGTPKSFSARVLGMVWAGFAMIIVASYTANLAAFLVLDKPEATISGIDDPRLRNPTESFKFATVKDSAIEQYFKRQVEFTTMYRTMENDNKANVEEAIEAVKDEKLNAFIWDSPRLIYEATKTCQLVTAGELFGRSSYGIAFKKNSHWTDEFSLKILSYHEVGKMERYDNKWINNASTSCEKGASSPATLGLRNMAGVFIMVATGIGIGFLILMIEIAYNEYETMKEKQNTIAKKAVARWKRYVQRRKALRKTWALIKDINDSDTISDKERQRIRAYLEAPSNDMKPVEEEGVCKGASLVDKMQYQEEEKQSALLASPAGVSAQVASGTPATLPPDLYSDGVVKHNPVFIDNSI